MLTLEGYSVVSALPDQMRSLEGGENQPNNRRHPPNGQQLETSTLQSVTSIVAGDGRLSDTMPRSISLHVDGVTSSLSTAPGDGENASRQETNHGPTASTPPLNGWVTMGPPAFLDPNVAGFASSVDEGISLTEDGVVAQAGTESLSDRSWIRDEGTAPEVSEEAQRDTEDAVGYETGDDLDDPDEYAPEHQEMHQAAEDFRARRLCLHVFRAMTDQRTGSRAVASRRM